MNVFKHNFVTAPVMTKIEEENGNRYYLTPSNKKYESVTRYINRLYKNKKPELDAWRDRIGIVKANKITRDSEIRGNALHKAAERYLLNEPMDLSDQPTTKSLFVKIKPFIETLNNIRLLEKPLYSDELQLAGTPDCIADWCDPPWEANLAVVDFKSKTNIHKKIFYIDHWIQTAIYARMFNELFHEMPKFAVLIMGCPTTMNAVVYKMPMDICQGMFENFRKDPEKFQEKVREIKDGEKLQQRK